MSILPAAGDTLLATLAANFQASGDIRDDASRFLMEQGYPHTAEHVAHVAAEARRLADRFGDDADRAETAAWLHDISAVIPNAERIAALEAFGLVPLPEERTLAMIAHQRLSAVIARHLFGITDGAILSAIACHTTSKAGATRLDTVVFVADKIAWDQPGAPPYLPALAAALDDSLDAGAFVYLDWLWQRRASLAVVHPWFRDAYLARATTRPHR